MIKVKGLELDFNFMNAAHVQKWEDARKLISEKYKDVGNVDMENFSLQEYVELIRRGCNAIFDFFDELFGYGTSNKLFGCECDFEDCVDAFQSFEDGVSAQSELFAQKVHRFAPIGKKGKSK